MDSKDHHGWLGFLRERGSQLVVELKVGCQEAGDVPAGEGKAGD